MPKRERLSTCLVVMAVAMLVLLAGHPAAAARLREPAAQVIFPSVHNVRLVGHLGTSPRAVAVQGTQAYVGMGREFAVLDLSDAAQPRRTGYLMLPQAVLGIDVAGSHAYVANSDGGLRIIDVSNPARPAEVGVHQVYSARSVTVRDHYAYLTTWLDDLRIVDALDPAAPTVAGTINLAMSEGRDLALSGDFAYVAANAGGLRVIDVADPWTPREVAAYEAVQQGVTSVDLEDGHAFLTDAASLQIVDVSNPTAPTFAGDWPTPGLAQDVDVAGGLAFLADYGYPGLHILDVSLPVSPTLVGTYTVGSPTEVVVSGTVAYVAAHRGLHLVDVARPEAPATLGKYTTLDLPLDVAAAGDFLYVADAKWGVHVVDVSDPAMPAVTGFAPAGITAVVAGDGTLYGVGSELWVIDVSDPASPTVAGVAEPGGQDVAVSGGYAYVAGWGGGLHVVDVSQPEAPTEVGVCGDLYASQVAIAGHHAFVTAGEEGIHAIDVSNPRAPTLDNTFHVPGSAADLQAAGNHLYVTWLYGPGGERGMTVLDISDPTAPVALDSILLTQEPRGIAVQWPLVYVTTGGSYPGVQVLDVSDPNDVVQVGAYDALLGAAGVAAMGDHVAVAGEGGGLYILRFQPHVAFLPVLFR